MPNARRDRRSAPAAATPRASGIRERSEHDTDPALPTVMELLRHRWEDLDRTLLFHLSRLESSVRGGVDARAASTIDRLVGDLDLLGAALAGAVEAARQASALRALPSEAWWPCVERIYEWASDVARELTAIVLVDGERIEDVTRSIAPLASHARLFVEAIALELVGDAIAVARAASCGEDLVSLLEDVQERALFLHWTLEAASGGAL